MNAVSSTDADSRLARLSSLPLYEPSHPDRHRAELEAATKRYDSLIADPAYPHHPDSIAFAREVGKAGREAARAWDRERERVGVWNAPGVVP